MTRGKRGNSLFVKNHFFENPKVDPKKQVVDHFIKNYLWSFVAIVSKSPRPVGGPGSVRG